MPFCLITLGNSNVTKLHNCVPLFRGVDEVIAAGNEVTAEIEHQLLFRRFRG